MFAVLNRASALTLPIDIQLQLFSSLVEPILTYGCEVWGHEDHKIPEGLHLKFCKYILGVKRSTPNAMVYGELGSFPIHITIKCKLIGFWLRLISSKESKLSFVMYKALLQLYNDNIYKSPWIVCIHNILNNCGLSNIWTNQNQCYLFNYTWVLSSVKRVLQDQFIQEWQESLKSSNKCTTYASFKQTFALEQYLISCSRSIYRSIVSFRTSNHRLPIEIGRYNNVERHQRICQICEGNNLGDEYHYLVECNNAEISELRNTYLPKFYCHRPSMFKFTQLMQRLSIKSKLCYPISMFMKGIMSIVK